MLHEIVQAHELELRSQERIIGHRMDWEEASRIPGLERGLRAAAARLSLPINREALAR